MGNSGWSQSRLATAPTHRSHDANQPAHRLRPAGVDATLRRYEGAIHGIFQMSRFTTIGARMLDDCVAALRAAIGSPTTAVAG